MSSKVEDILNKIEKNEINFDEANHFDFSSFTKEEILELKQRLDVYSLEKNTKQMALKIALNSLYGAQANQYFPLFNRDSAASITFMGRYLIQKTGENVEKFLEEKFGEYNYWVYGDTDSVGVESVIRTDKYGNEKIGVLFEKINGTNIKKGQDKFLKHIDEKVHTFSLNPTTKKIEVKPIKFMWKHLVKKEMYEIEIDSKKVRVTEDHSIIVEDKKGNIVSKKPSKIEEGDSIFLIK